MERMQRWYITAEDEHKGGTLRIEFTYYHIETLICILLKQKRNRIIGEMIKDLYLDTKKDGKNRLKKLGIP